MDVDRIDWGQRGELVAILLIMQARDTLARSTGKRWVKVCDFLEKLLGKIAVKHHFHVDQRPLAEASNDAHMWFSHVFWSIFILRGAMILCADNLGSTPFCPFVIREIYSPVIL